MLPSEVAFVEGRELLRNKKKKRGARDTADEEYFEKILKQDLKEMNRDCDNDDDDDEDYHPTWVPRCTRKRA
jgi:hypothetical protein